MVRVGRFDLVIDDTAQDIEKIVDGIRQALADKTVVEVPVLDENREPQKLYINGAQAEAVVVDTGLRGPKPGEMS
jgi:hypothetical protein